MSNPGPSNHTAAAPPPQPEQEEDLPADSISDESEDDYYDPHEDLAQFHDDRIEIEESWLEWERQNGVGNRQNYLFQKPGSAKRRDRRERYTSLSTQGNHQTNAPGRRGSGSGAPVLDTGSSSTAAVEKLRSLGTYRPALASSIVHSYSNLSWEAVQAARDQRLAAKAVASTTGQNYICALPVELLAHIVSHLEPNELFDVSLVCQLFYHVVNADSCWKEAFIKFFGASIPFKRLDAKSWRGEYIRRTRLLRRWEKGRGSNVMIDPKIGPITSLWAETDNRVNENWFLGSALAEGVVARFNPSLGKLQKDAVFRMMHLLHAEVSVMAMDRHRVLWGLSTGQVSLTTLAYAAAGQTFQTFAGFHDGPVQCLKLVPNCLGFVLTGGVDGVVKLWDVSKARCVREFRTGSSLVGDSTSRIDFICCDPESHIVAGTSKGEIYIFPVDISSFIVPASAPASGVSSPARTASTDNISAMATAASTADPPNLMPAAAASGTATPLAKTKVIKLPEEFSGVGYLEVYFGRSHSGLILARTVNSTVMHVYNLETLDLLATLKSPAHFSPITAVHWDIPKYEKPMVSLSNSGGTGHRLHGRPEMSSLLVTGDGAGNICLWYLADLLKNHADRKAQAVYHPSQTLKETLILAPTCVLKGHDTQITSLFVDKLLIVSGSNDGWVKAWNPVNGVLISVLNSGYIRGRELNDMTSVVVKNIVINSLQCRGVVSIGGFIRSWDFSAGANLSKDKYRKHAPKKAVHYSAGPKNKIQNDIRNSLQESSSLKRLELQASERRAQMHRRYNNLEGLNMNDMTDEELVEYVMMVSKEKDDKDLAQELDALQQVQEYEADQTPQFPLGGNAGEGSSTSKPVGLTLHSLGDDEAVSEQERREEEELVNRAIAMSMLEMDSGEHSHGSSHDLRSLHDHHDMALDHNTQPHTPLEWELHQMIDVDAQDTRGMGEHEDLKIVQAVLQELEEEEDRLEGSDETKIDVLKDQQPAMDEGGWPSINGDSTGSVPRSGPLSVSQVVVSQVVDAPKKMSWSMVARTNSGSSLSSNFSPASTSANGQPSIIRQYASAPVEEEDEETLLARILSLSMVEK